MLQSLYSLAATGSFCWFLASSLWIYPHSLSYFNESVGGPLNGPEHLLGSNVDWGQDLRYFLWHACNCDKRAREEQVCLAYFGAFDPEGIGLSVKNIWNAKRGVYQQTTSIELNELRVYSYVISESLLRGYPHQSRDGDSLIIKLCEPLVAVFQSVEPKYEFGYSLPVYSYPMPVPNNRVD